MGECMSDAVREVQPSDVPRSKGTEILKEHYRKVPETVFQKYVVSEVARMDRPSTSQPTEKVEMFEVQEHVPYRGQMARSPNAYDEESNDIYDTTWSTAWSAICQLYNTLNHMMIAIIVFTIWRFALTAEANGTVSRFELHMVFAGTGFQLFLSEAVLTLHSHNSWSLQLSRDSKRVVHGCLQLVGGLFVIAGTTMALAEVEWRMTTGHGICGLIAFIFTIISMLNGIITLFSSKVRLMVKNGPMKIFHICTALIALSVGLVTIALGFNMDYFRASGESLSIAMMLMTLLTLVYLLVNPIMNLVQTGRKMM